MKANRSNRRKNGSPMTLEAMESRQLLSVTPYTVGLSSGNDVVTVSYGAPPILAQAPYLKIAAGPAGGRHAAAMRRSLATAPVIHAALGRGATVGAEVGFNQLTITVNGNTWKETLATGQSVLINALQGDDKITISGNVNVQVNGGAGNDTIISGNGNDTLNGEAGNDFIDGGNGADIINGGADTDTVDYSTRNVGVNATLEGFANDGQSGEGDNIGSDIEIINGGWGNDYITGNLSDAVARVLNGNAGNDTVIGGLGADQINGGTGNDLINGYGGNDIIHGGAGDDTDGGGSGDDVIFADSGNDVLYGDANNDRLYGGTGVNMLHGGDGDDTLISIGGSHADRQWGELGTDSFWLDGESTESVMDVSFAETAANVHRVSAYDSLHIGDTNYGAPARGMNVGSLVDPNNVVSGTTFTYKNYAGHPLFDGATPHADDVEQGLLGDCYFMAPLSSIAKSFPNVIKQSIVDLGDGSYAVQFKQDGVNHFVRVDADLPTFNGTPGFAHWTDLQAAQSMWVPIMEKAWAFFSGAGSYSEIEGGNAEEPYQALGMSYDTYGPHGTLGIFGGEDPQELGKHIYSLLSAGKAVTFCTNDDGVLLSDHCYMVDHVNFTGTTVSAIVLRNPWGSDSTNPSHDGNLNDGYITLNPSQALAAVDHITSANA